MRMILVIYSGPAPDVVPAILDAQETHGYTRFSHAHGAGASGRKEGTRAWPGDAEVYFSVVAAEAVDPILQAVRKRQQSAVPGERLHAAALPVESFL